MSGREIIASWFSGYADPQRRTDNLIQALTAAGYRLIGPGEVDPAQHHLCGLPEFGAYEGQVVLVAPEWLRAKWPSGIGIDVCLSLEVQTLWKIGIHTTGHCCGHGRAGPFISVEPTCVEQMLALGYRTYDHPQGRDDHFVPKTILSRDALTEAKS